MTSIEWLIEQISILNTEVYNELKEEFEQAKEIHKQEIVEAWKDGEMYNTKESNVYAEKYYNETFKKD